MPERSFYDDPALYDRVSAPPAASVDFYVDLAREARGDVLELACGTGRVTIPIALALAGSGRSVAGLDLAPAMLEVARAKSAAAGVAPDLISGDMRHFAFDRHFDLIFVARNSLLHLLSTADLVAAFTTIRRHLTPDGVFAFDIFHPDVRWLAKPAGQRYTLMDVDTATFGLLRVEDVPDYDAALQINRGTWYISTPDTQDAWVVPLVLRSIFPQELPLLLAAAGLDLVDRFGDVSRSPFSAGSRLQVCLCRRRA